MKKQTNERKWCVYMHTNKINNMVYVGITSNKASERWNLDGSAYLRCRKDGKYDHPKFAPAILEYGWDNFEHIIFAENLTYKEACQQERLLIALWDSFDNGYNASKGTNGSYTQRKKHKPFKVDLTGKKFGKLTVIRYDHTDKNRNPIWECLCDCGNTAFVQGHHLKSGHSKSCGCTKIERIGNINRKTGLTNTRLYYAYRNMLNRCYYPGTPMYQYYGGEGKTVCDEWRDKEHGFENFVEWATNNGYEEGLQIDRIDNNGNYEPSNCKWSTDIEQANNKRTTLRLKVNGEIDTVGNWARRLGISYWNLNHYAHGGRNCKYPDLKVEVVE